MSEQRVGNSVFVSGASGYLGSRLSKRLAARGFELVLSSKSSKGLKKLETEIRESFPATKVSTISIDLTETLEWQRLSSFLDEIQIRHYINCSALQGSPNTDSKTFDIDEFRKVMKVNLEASINFTLYFAEKWNPNEVHSIIHFSGGGATSPRPLFDAYSLSKTALIRFIENVSHREQFRNISINAIAPGLMPSRMQENILGDSNLINTSEHRNAERSFHRENEFTDETIALCEFLLDEKNAGISGKIISSRWDNWRDWPRYKDQLMNSDLYTLRRVTGHDRGQNWGDRR